MALPSGARLGGYEVVGLLGVGGMGEVYRARDTRLERQVAIKVLPEAVRADPERVARFEREAKLLASLNHPNIAAIYGLEQAQGEQFIVMELVEGPTLADRIAQGPIPLDEALPIARQIAEALEAAHEQGIIHRDLKPANVKVRPDGTAKVLDFGLAKALEPASAMAAATLTNSPTITSPVGLTGPGVLLGTAAYMSPEQARGQIVDKRSDIWAFGCVLYEMLTGRRAFEAASLTNTLAAIVGRDVDWAALPAATPDGIRRLLRRCLTKERRQRLSDVADARLEIDDALNAPISQQLAQAPHRTVRMWRLVAALAIVSTIVLSGLRFADSVTQRPISLKSTRLTMVPTAGAPLRLDTSTRALTISPDGTRVVYLGNPGTLVVRALDQLESQTINGVGAASHPFFSPDGQWIAFFDGNTVKKVAAAGGPIQLIARLNSTPSGGSWGPNNVIVLSVAGEEGTGLVQVSAAGGVPEMLTTPDRAAGESYHHWPEILPGGQAVLFALIGGPGVGGTAVLDLKTRKWRRVLDLGRISAQYVEPGYLIYVFAGTVFAARFDVKRLEVTSAEVPVGVDHVADVAIGAHVSIARDGTLIYVPQPPPLSLTWVDRQNRREPLGAPPGPYQGVRLSPDATRAVLATREGSDLLVWDLQRRSFTRLTKEGGFDLNPTWTPDGTRLVWTSGRASRGGLDLFAQSADGTGPVKQLTESNNAQLALDITPDGRQLLVGLTGPRTSLDMALLPLDPTGTLTTRLATPTTLLATPFDERLGKVSPDGRWLAYDSNENGAFEVFVRPFPDVNTAKWQVSTGGGSQPLWARSGRELFYRGLDGSVVSVSIQPEGNQLRRGIPATVIAGSSFLNETMSLLPQQTYDVMTDGSRFLMIQEGTSSSIASGPVIVVVQNLLNELAVRLSPN